MRAERLKVAATCACTKCEHFGVEVIVPSFAELLRPVHTHFKETPNKVFWCELAHANAIRNEPYVYSYQILALNKDGKQIEFTEEWKQLRGVWGCGNKEYFETPTTCPFELEHVMANGRPES